MQKKGQLTIFIIIAIIVVVIGILIFVFYPQIKENFISQEDSISLFVQSCIEDTGKDAIYYIGQKGGYFISPSLSNSEGIPYYYLDKENYMPLKENIENEISEHINNLLPLCTQNFIDYSEFNITQEKVETKTRIKEEEIILDVKYPLTIKKGETIKKVENFKNIKIPVRLNIIYNSIKEIIQDQLNHEDICLSCISEIVNNNELKIDLTNVDDGVVFTIIDYNSELKNVPLEFKFANKY